jgi:hypothetical protein
MRPTSSAASAISPGEDDEITVTPAAPASAKARAIARPMPRLPPVMSATLPASKRSAMVPPVWRQSRGHALQETSSKADPACMGWCDRIGPSAAPNAPPILQRLWKMAITSPFDASLGAGRERRSQHHAPEILFFENNSAALAAVYIHVRYSAVREIA